jgi:hypothetical protein
LIYRKTGDCSKGALSGAAALGSLVIVSVGVEPELVNAGHSVRRFIVKLVTVPKVLCLEQRHLVVW